MGSGLFQCMTPFEDAGFLSLPNFKRAWEEVSRGHRMPGSDGVSVDDFALRADEHIAQLLSDVKVGRYWPQPVRGLQIPKQNAGFRLLGIPCVIDRILLVALKQHLTPLWSSRFPSNTFAYRSGSSASAACMRLSGHIRKGNHWLAILDVADFFDSVSHSVLEKQLRSWVSSVNILRLLLVTVRGTSLFNGKGLLQGSPISPLLSNVYMHDLDSFFETSNWPMVRFSDNIAICAQTKNEMEQRLQQVVAICRQLELTCPEERIRRVNVACSQVDFLGFTFTAAGYLPSEQSEATLREKMNSLGSEQERAQLLNGWKNYFALSPLSGQRHTDYIAQPVSPYAGLSVKSMTRNVEEEAAILEKYFVQRADVFAIAQNKITQYGYCVCRRPIGREDLMSHVRGTSAIGTYLLRQDGMARAMVLDIDDVDRARGNSVGQDRALLAARAIAAKLMEHGLEVSIFNSGDKGYHVWLLFANPVNVSHARRDITAWLDEMRPFAEGVLVEIFPKGNRSNDKVLGSLIRLPLGLHPLTGRRCDPVGTHSIERGDGSNVQPVFNATPIGWQWAEPPISPPDNSHANEEVRRLFAGCGYLRGIATKAREKKKLSHTERLVLLYVLSALGAPGTAALHEVLSACSNYHPGITAKWIIRSEQGANKILSCARIHEWVTDFYPRVACPCQVGNNKSPLAWLAHEANAVSEAMPSTDGWRDEIDTSTGSWNGQHEPTSDEWPELGVEWVPENGNSPWRGWPK